jgi:hypothetical protein
MLTLSKPSTATRRWVWHAKSARRDCSRVLFLHMNLNFSKLLSRNLQISTCNSWTLPLLSSSLPRVHHLIATFNTVMAQRLSYRSTMLMSKLSGSSWNGEWARTFHSTLSRYLFSHQNLLKRKYYTRNLRTKNTTMIYTSSSRTSNPMDKSMIISRSREVVSKALQNL